MARGITLEFDFAKAPTLCQFFNDDDFVRICVGPVGSSKTTAFCVEVMKRAMQQAPSPIDNVRYFKAAIVRNTMPELWRTTIETWLAIFREDQCGPMRRSAPVHHHIKIPPNSATGEPGLDLLVDFFAMDKPDNVRALLSYEGTLIWFNEVREIPRSVVKAATDRAGRYPSMAKNSVMPTWFGVIGDTNPPDEDHWIHEFYLNPPEYYKIYKQPPGVFECKEYENEDGEKYWRSTDPRGIDVQTTRPDRVLVAGSRTWIANPFAENLENLPLAPGSDDYLGRGGYYLFRVSGKDYDWVRGYYQGDFGPIFDGKPVIPEFNRDIHISADIQVLDGVPIIGGFDIGGGTLNSAGVLGQKHPRGPYLILDEISPDGDGIGLAGFSEDLSRVIANRFPGMDCKVQRFWGDPAGRQRDALFAVTVFDHLQAMGLPVMEAPSNDPRLRIEAIKAPMGRLVDGKPGIIIHPRCRNLIKGLQGAWSYKRIQVSSSNERFRDIPDKNEYSHVCDALGYMLLGSGEGNSLRGRTKAVEKSTRYQAPTKFKIL
jgi:hypothetical protein